MAIFIPKQINVGFQNRDDTYTGKLAYVIYFDEKGKLRKESSWQNWRDKEIPNEIHDNEPIDGFVLNKKAGGVEESYGWDVRKTYIRVYDPRGFEFEISVPNLLWILQNCDCIKGKGLDGQFVYGFDGAELVLVPVESPDYKEIAAKNKVRHDNTFIKAKDLVVGATYEHLNGKRFVYMGKFKPWTYQCRSYKHGEFDGGHGWINSQLDRYCETPSMYKNVQSDKAEFFFIRLGDKSSKYSWERKNIVTVMKTVTRKFTNIVCDKNEQYLDHLETLNSSRTYSPYDYNNEQIVDLPFENFEATLNKFKNDGKGYWYRYSKQFAVKSCEVSTCTYNLDYVSVFYDDEKESFYTFVTEQETYFVNTFWGKEQKVRKITHKKYYDTVRELYDAIRPVYGVAYLENGYEYKKEYYYGTDGTN